MIEAEATPASEEKLLGLNAEPCIGRGLLLIQHYCLPRAYAFGVPFFPSRRRVLQRLSLGLVKSSSFGFPNACRPC